jgi:hypothetical protein
MLLQAGQHGEIALIQYRVGNLVLRLQAWSAFSFTISKGTVFCPCSVSRLLQYLAHCDTKARP